jgi:hypothetical protein
MNPGEKSILKWGGIASILMTVMFIWVGVAMMFDPVERYRGEEFWQTLADKPGIQTSWRVAFFFVGVLALAVIPAATQFVRSPNGRGEGLLRWVTALAYIGTASLAIDSMRGVNLLYTDLIDAYKSGDEVRQLIAKSALGGGTDVQGFFQYGGVGLWYIVVGVLALQNKRMPKPLAYLGIASGVGYFSTLVFGLTDTFIPGTDIAAQAMAAFFAGGFVAPIYHAWFGRILLREARSGERQQTSRQAELAPAGK